jgi:sn-glycerol 3-phosphate transport system permease protein
VPGAAAPFARYFFNTFVLVTLTLGCQLVLCTLAAYAFRALRLRRQQLSPFALVLAQLMIMPDVLIVENLPHHEPYRHHRHHPAIALP